MLCFAYKMCELNFDELMLVYEEGNRENGAESYPDEPEMYQIQLAEQDFREYLQSVFFKTKGAFYAILEKDGHYVSALRLEPFRDGLLLEALETKPSERKKGFAALLIRSVLQEVETRPVYSHINKRNKPSQKTHAACGFRKLHDFAEYIDGSVSSRADTWINE